jgi:cyclic pyranopterin phosphate synthase
MPADPSSTDRGAAGRRTPLRLEDAFGRVATDLRVSLTDHCNLRCTYCMPAEGLPWMAKPQMLTDDEVVRLVGIFVRLGVTKVRLTGGEPLLRAGLPDLVGRLAALEPRPHLAMTTNGLGPHPAGSGVGGCRAGSRERQPGHGGPRDVPDLDAARDRLDDVVAGLAAADAAGLRPVKVNAVAMRGVNDAGVVDLLEWCFERGYELRFIEQMPLDAQHSWQRAEMISAAEIRARIEERHALTPQPDESRGSAPAELFLVDGGPATVGIIASVTAPFCGACDRVRLTADGMVRNCLFARGEVDLRGPLRDGADDAELVRLIKGEMWRKARGHGIGAPDFTQPARPMSAIGG